jgi:hypothetical protein
VIVAGFVVVVAFGAIVVVVVGEFAAVDPPRKRSKPTTATASTMITANAVITNRTGTVGIVSLELFGNPGAKAPPRNSGRSSSPSLPDEGAAGRSSVILSLGIAIVA